jgi:hypothetical protein
VTQPPTPAQEAISNAMIAALISCATLSLGIITYLDLTTMPAYLNLTMTSLLVTGYIVPTSPHSGSDTQSTTSWSRRKTVQSLLPYCRRESQ